VQDVTVGKNQQVSTPALPKKDTCASFILHRSPVAIFDLMSGSLL
jgi:hypothetical protein